MTRLLSAITILIIVMVSKTIHVILLITGISIPVFLVIAGIVISKYTTITEPQLLAAAIVAVILAAIFYIISCNMEDDEGKRGRKGHFLFGGGDPNFRSPNEIKKEEQKKEFYEKANEVADSWQEIIESRKQQIAYKKATRSREAAQREQQANQEKLETEAGMQKLIQYLGGIRDVIDDIEDGQDNSIQKQIINGFIDSIRSDHTITTKHKSLKDIKNDVKLLLERLKELRLERDMVTSRIKDTFKI